MLSENEGFRRQEGESLNPYMKLRQNGVVSFSIRLDAFQARGTARVKLRQNGIVSLMIRPAVFFGRRLG
jgi:hypothetical protein